MRPILVPVALLCLAAAPPGRGPLEAEEIHLRSGLVGVYRSGVPGDPVEPIWQIDPGPAFTWGTSSPHPRLPAGPFTVTWTGYLELREPHTVRFGAFVSGKLLVTLDGETVLSGQGRDLTASIDSIRSIARPHGKYPIRIEYASNGTSPARVQLFWEGKSFAREPLPSHRLKHVLEDLSPWTRLEESALRGRDLVGRLGCARCHRDAFPGVADPPPGPTLSDLGSRVGRDWLLAWLAEPARLRPGSRMPNLFPSNAIGVAERALLADYLMAATSKEKRAPEVHADYRSGRQTFIGLGCIACHLEPGQAPTPGVDPERQPLTGLRERFPLAHLSAFLQTPTIRYPDGRMPRLPVPPDQARHLATYLLQDAKPVPAPALPVLADPKAVAEVMRRLDTTDRNAAGAALFHSKGCVRCHEGVAPTTTTALPIRNLTGCLSRTDSAPGFVLGAAQRQDLRAYLGSAPRERQPSAFTTGQELLRRLRCHRCHQRDSDRPAPLEEAGRTVWAPHLYRQPFQRTPRLTQVTARLQRDYLHDAIRNGVQGVRPDWYSYRMPAFGAHADAVVRALSEAEGELPPSQEAPRKASVDPTLTALGPILVGFEGYSCVSCHIWEGKSLAAVEPGSVGPEMHSLTNRIRRTWFERFLDDPARVHPGTPMPSIFRRGEQAPLASVLQGNSARQKEAIWEYLSLGKKASSPKPREPIPIDIPSGRPLVSLIPLQLPDQRLVESLCVLFSSHDALVYDLAQGDLLEFFTGARLLRQANVWRGFQLTGTPSHAAMEDKKGTITLLHGGTRRNRSSKEFLGYDPLPDGVRVRWRWRFGPTALEVGESLRLLGRERKLRRDLHLAGLPAGASLEVPWRQGGLLPPKPGTTTHSATWAILLPPASVPAPVAAPVLTIKADEGQIGPITRPGYRALPYPRPKTATGEDLIMPSALAVDPRDGRVFVASMKLGDLFVVGREDSPRFERYGPGPFQDVFAMLHDGKDLVVLHRRNLSRLREGGKGIVSHVDRLATVGHGVGNAYDWAYGLTRDRKGAFLYTLAPHANQHQPGAGSLLRQPDAIKGDPVEIAYGFRNPLGWCSGPEGEVFFTDNQGDWVATNKLCHVVEGKYYGYPNSRQRQHTRKEMAPTAVWIPYGWAKSINGVAYDSTGGRFGPFAGQFFLAELMHGGAILRADVEKVNGVYQGACFPFWDRPLLGPLSLAFDPRGTLYVGAVTTPGWMGQPDRGALFRIEFTGQTPFEIQSIRIRPQGFRLTFTRPIDPASAQRRSAYQIEHHRYEYTGAYGSPELDRTRVEVRSVTVLSDRRSVELLTTPLVRGRVYTLAATGVRSTEGETLVHPTGAYTVNEIPAR